MQHGGEEEFRKKMEEQGYTDNMFKHIKEINELKARIYRSSTFINIEETEKDKLFDEIINELMDEITIEWN